MTQYIAIDRFGKAVTVYAYSEGEARRKGMLRLNAPEVRVVRA